MPLAPGTMVNANVRLLDMLGQGGMGSVWLADHLGLDARVAVKFIAPELIEREPSLRQRFKREASICARLRSIHAVQTFDHGAMEDGTPYIVMELLEGETLTDRIETHGPMPAREMAMLMAQVAKVLHRAHILGIVHRDIKPDNIFLTQDSDYDLFVKVLDFGIAKEQRAVKPASATVTKTGAVVGTPEFMSPEQALSSKNIDHRSDLFSLGVVAFYGLTGELPYDPEGNTALWFQMSQGDHLPVRTFLPDAPEELEAFFRHALKPRPETRFQSARIMARAFSIAVSAASGRVVDELSSSDDSLSLPAAPISFGSLGEEESWPDMSSILASREPERPTVPVPASDSMPAMYDLLGPDSDDFQGEDTVLMNAEDHREAESEESPPTPRYEPRTVARPGVYAAVRAGVYNSGERGAFNALVHLPETMRIPIVRTLVDHHEPPLREVLATLPPVSTRSSRRTITVVALSLAVIGAVTIALLRLGLG
jgi:eukaryotic-like serine/threonine-protein kinase